MGVITIVDRAVLAAYFQAYRRWVEAELKLNETPLLFKTPSGYLQQSPWLNIANRQMELMSRYMADIGLTLASRSRVMAISNQEPLDIVTKVEFVTVYEDAEGKRHERESKTRDRYRHRIRVPTRKGQCRASISMETSE